MAAVDFPANTGNYKGEGRKKYEWSVAQPPLCRPSSGLTPADYFGRTLVEKLPDSIRIGVVHVAVGGCAIEHMFKEYDPAQVKKEAGWFQNFMSGYDNLPYIRIIDLALRAQKQGVIKGILMHQDETNTGQKNWPDKVNKVYNDMLHDLSLEAKNVPLLAGEVLSKKVGGVCASMNDIIKTLPETIPTSAVISADGLPCAGYHLHFTAAGYREMGIRYANTYMDMMHIAPVAKEEPKAADNGKGKAKRKDKAKGKK